MPYATHHAVGSKPTLNRLIRVHSKKMVRCRTCLESLSLGDYVHKHALERHGWNRFRVCIYCSGGECWPLKHRNFKHIVPCLKRFLTEKAPIDRKPCEECKAFRSRPRDLYGRLEKRDVCKGSDFYESYFERPEAYGESDVTFTEESGLGRDVYAIVKRFLRGDLKWYHLMVMQENFDNFVKFFERMKDRMFVLPFWCLCDGLTESRKTHRHMIMAFEPGAPFKYIWENQVKCKLEEGGRSKTSVELKTAFHLIRTIQYVSHPKASCDRKLIRDAVGRKFRNSHFYINRPLHEHAIACMSTMFRGGLQCLLDEQLKNKNVVGWLKHVKTKRVCGNLKYVVPIGVTGFKFLNCVLPLSPEFEPSEKATNLWLYWIGNKKLYLKIDSNLKNVSREEWYARQVEKGNTLTSLSEEGYALCYRQHGMMTQIKTALVELREEMGREYDARITALETKNADLKEKVTALQSENVDFRGKVTALESENVDFRGKVTALESEIADLREDQQTVVLEAKFVVGKKRNSSPDEKKKSKLKR